MTTTIYTRRAGFRPASLDRDSRTFEAVASTGADVRRQDSRGAYVERLDLSAIDPASLVGTTVLDAHRQGSHRDAVGVLEAARMEGGALVVTIKTARGAEGDAILERVEDGILRGVSIGYSAAKTSETRDASGQRVRTIQPEIREISLVPIPADPGATVRSGAIMEDDNLSVQTRAEINAEIRSIARATGLDQNWIDGQIDADASLDAVRADALATMQRRSQAAGGIRSTGRVTADHNDPLAIRSAMADALAHRIAPGVCPLEGRGVEYRGWRILDMVGTLAAASGERINVRDQDALLQRAVGAHSTSDFPLLLADAANKALMAQYQVAAPTYRKWAAQKPFADFKERPFLRAGDFPAFKEINENGEVKYGTMSENAEKVRAKEFGTGIVIGRRALVNDDLGALADFSSMIATRAAVDENRLAYGVLAANAALSDTVALFHADHGNKAASGTVLDGANVAVAVAALRGQKSLDGMALNLQPAFLVVGPQQEVAARQLLAAVTAAKSADVNVWTGFAELIVDAEITDKRWHLFAAPGGAPVVVYGYVAGAEGPQIRTERDFDTQALKVAASLDFAAGAVDFRGAYLNAGT